MKLVFHPRCEPSPLFPMGLAPSICQDLTVGTGSQNAGVWWDVPGKHPGSDRLAQMCQEASIVRIDQDRDHS